MSRRVSNLVSVLLSFVLVIMAFCGWSLTHHQNTNYFSTDTGLDSGAARRTLEGLVENSIYINDPEIPLSSTIGYNTYYTQLALETFNELNDIRQDNGLAPLQWDDSLKAASMIRAKECSIKWSHTRPNGQSYWTADSKHIYGENLAYGYETADEALEAWMQSPTHKANILDNEFTTMAISVYMTEDGTYYWANEFGI